MGKLPIRPITPTPLPYRPGVGVVLFNPRGLVWTGRRRENTETSGGEWQFPQGGIDPGENPRDAASRELHEETGVQPCDTTLLAETPQWIDYDLPQRLIGVALRGKFRGQRQKWFALRFIGRDDDINPSAQPNPEFDLWAWRPLDDAARLIIPFKRHVYVALAHAFSAFARAPQSPSSAARAPIT